MLPIALAGLSALCALGCETPAPTGTTVPTEFGVLVAPESARPDRVALYFAPADRPYRVLGVVTAATTNFGYASLAEAEGGALEHLRFQAALVEADAVIDIERQLIDTGSWTTYYEDVFLERHDGDVRRSGGFRSISGSARENRDIEVNIRGRAVRWLER